MSDMRIAKLNHLVNQGALIKDMCKSPGFKILKSKLDERVSDLKNKWLKADDDEAKRIKLRAQVYAEIEDELKKLILEGNAAAMQLRNIPDDSGSTTPE